MNPEPVPALSPKPAASRKAVKRAAFVARLEQDQPMRALYPIRLVTSLAQRLFRKHFDYLAKIHYLRKDRPELMAQLVKARAALHAGLVALQNTEALQPLPEWQLLGDAGFNSKALEQQLIVYSGHDVALAKAFCSVDALLLPVFAAYVARLIDRNEFEHIKAEVQQTFAEMVTVYSSQTFLGSHAGTS